ncbi:uncharacterized protein LACBIDRAFT_312466 [Laccaria bicolor S238N-H82]|uniref:Predicted protein n=1 Tax=Laccaria bicolor (strain S238N-H82 / ATCC MYA-4686) TaxID=486041 RepID=B0DN93_LACBS|nr:uncharacterized protein LACBIDRAFT_306536 [Laccaria bicolor S238N-H82]XP_001888186.1 uncharacterized protein LACBIDRAFT_312466 [Laccaria bicolor S238N-H82]EDR01144.1 predicted protein [Laccaria bicolor S238N-H82]EDR03896.1 predicted protein [Laccaria bicolor S238N-H82]|eukprot:XP_001885464.1 predicted protein [Laccaria bicolor S238N-H82]
MPPAADQDPSQQLLPGNSAIRTTCSALELGPRKKPGVTDPLVHHGRHFGRTVHAFCNIRTLINNGILRLGELADQPDESFSAEERREHKIFLALLQSVVGLEERLLTGSEEETGFIAELLRRGASGARGDDTKSLKGAILEWITPKGESLNPPLARNMKLDRGFHHECTGALLCPTNLDWSDPETKERLRSGEQLVTGDQWPIFLYAGCNFDPEEPWNGLLRNRLLIYAFKHVFTSPSSVDKEPKATRSGNARIHGMRCVTAGSIAYIATQVRFALCSSPVFSRTDMITDSERFFSSILELLEDPREAQEVHDLYIWWNRQVFPSYSSAQRIVTKDSALAKIQEKRRRVLTTSSIC